MSVLSVKNLTLTLIIKGKHYPILQDINFSLPPSSATAVVGESGCGKTLLCRSLLRLTPPNMILSGKICLPTMNGQFQSITTIPEKELMAIRGRQIGFIFQEASLSLNPVIRCGHQIMDALSADSSSPASQRKERTLALLKQVGLTDPKRVFHSFPHQLSGGMLQRVALAIALAGNPRLLIADEPSTSLDIIAQQHYFELLATQKSQFQLALLLVTHDLGIAAKYADHLIVLYAGEIVEQGRTLLLQESPSHPYTYQLRNIARSLRTNQFPDPIEGEPPAITDPPTGCRFHPRCTYRQSICSQQKPPLIQIDNHHSVRCYFPID